MKIKNSFIILMLASLLLVSCDKKSDKNKPNPNIETPTNNDTNNSLKPYRFFRDGVSSVDIGESEKLINDFRVFNIAVNSGRLTNLTSNKERLENSLLPECCKLISKEDAKTYKNLISSLMSHLEELSKGNNSDRRASKGHAGFIQVDNDTKRILDSKGQQIGQVLQKALMGALQLDKINFYLDKAVENSSEIDKVVNGKHYTLREHYWDIAYGFVGRNDIDKKRSSPLFLANYIEKETVGMKGLENLEITIYQAFYKGREAAANLDINAMKEQKKIIQSNINKMMKLRTIFYLNESSSIITKTNHRVEASYFHNMGEALGFILALPFVNDDSGKPIISVEKSIELYNSILDTEFGVYDTERLSGIGKGSIQNVIKSISSL